MISGSYWFKNDRINEIYNFGFIEIYRCFGTVDQIYWIFLKKLVIGSKTSVSLDKTEVVDLVDAVIFEPVAPRDHCL